MENLSRYLKGNADLPSFPPRKLFGNTDPEFIKSRQFALDSYFKILFTNPQCEKILDSGNIKDFLYSEIWMNVEENLQENLTKLRNWGEISQSGDKFFEVLNEELYNLENKFNEIFMDMDVLEQNDTIWILHFEEKIKEELNK